MPLAVKAVYAFPYGDKLGHFLLMGCLALLLNLVTGKRALSVGKWKIWLGSAAAALIVTLEELSQFAFPLRTPDILDWAASMLGIMLAGASLRYFQRLD